MIQSTTDNRKLSELLQLILDSQQFFRFGLCNWVYDLYVNGIISTREYDILDNYIKNNRPSIFSSFDAFYRTIILNSDWYWTKRKIKFRIEWLEKHIKIQKQKEKNITSFTITYK